MSTINPWCDENLQHAILSLCSKNKNGFTVQRNSVSIYNFYDNVINIIRFQEAKYFVLNV